MRLMRLGAPGAEIPVVLTAEGSHLDLRPLTADIDGAFLAGPGLDQARAAVEAGTLPALDATGLRIGPPVARPGVVLCIGMNYAAHAAETGAAPPAAPGPVLQGAEHRRRPRRRRAEPARGDQARLGGRARRRHRHAARATSSPPAQALDHVAGYAISNDVSERAFPARDLRRPVVQGQELRDLQPARPLAGHRGRGARPAGTRPADRVNGEPRQDSTTKDMVFTVAELIYQLSQVTVLEPGDIINTGTPQGVALSGRFPYLVPGDTVELEIDGLGRQRQLVAQA